MDGKMKQQRRLRPIDKLPESSGGAQPARRLRIDGDDLYAWGRLVQQMATLQQQAREMGQAFVQAHGLTFPEYIVDDAGYIIPNGGLRPVEATPDATQTKTD